MNANTFRPIVSRIFSGFWETVTLYPRVAPGSSSSFSPSSGYTLYRARREESARSDGAPMLGEERLTWVIFQTDLDNSGAAAPPKVSDVLQDANGVRWSVVRVTKEIAQQSYPCDCVRERTAATN
jgi:hypothetical protein